MTQETALATTTNWSQLSLTERPPELLATSDMLAELDEGGHEPIVKFDGRTGRFTDAESGEDLGDSLLGSILAVKYKQTFFPNEAEADAWPKWICRNENRKFEKPILHPDLNEAQRAEALERGAGHDCRTCRLNDWQAGDKPACKSTINLLWAGAGLGEVVTVQAGGTSIKTVEAYLNNLLRKQRLPAYAVQTTLRGEKQAEGSRNWFSLVPVRGADNSLPVVQNLLGLRDDVQAHQARTAAPPPSPAVAPPTPQQPAASRPAAPPTAAPPQQQPAANRGRGITLDAQGRPVLPGEQPPAPAAREDLGMQVADALGGGQNAGGGWGW